MLISLLRLFLYPPATRNNTKQIPIPSTFKFIKNIFQYKYKMNNKYNIPIIVPNTYVCLLLHIIFCNHKNAFFVTSRLYRVNIR